jgi:hypothetical protein
MGLPGQGADLPHLIQLLKNEYVAHCKEQGILTDPNTRPAADFWEFCGQYLDKNRVVENWPADSNIGVRLSNNQRALLSPASNAGTGQMEETHSVSVTEGKSQDGQEGVVDGKGRTVI